MKLYRNSHTLCVRVNYDVRVSNYDPFISFVDSYKSQRLAQSYNSTAEKNVSSVLHVVLTCLKIAFWEGRWRFQENRFPFTAVIVLNANAVVLLGQRWGYMRNNTTDNIKTPKSCEVFTEQRYVKTAVCFEILFINVIIYKTYYSTIHITGLARI